MASKQYIIKEDVSKRVSVFISILPLFLLSIPILCLPLPLLHVGAAAEPIQTYSVFSSDPHCVGEWHLDEGAGTIAVDGSYYRNNGTISGAVWVSGAKGGALFFDGINDRLDINKTDILGMRNAVSVSFLVKGFTDTNFRYAMITDGFCIYQNKQTIGMTVYAPTPNSASVDIVAGEWTHIAATYDGIDIKIYKNGILMKTTNHPGTMSKGSDTLHIGVWPGMAFWKGTLDEIYLFNRTLTDSDILSLYTDAGIPESAPIHATLGIAAMTVSAVLFCRRRKRTLFYRYSSYIKDETKTCRSP